MPTPPATSARARLLHWAADVLLAVSLAVLIAALEVVASIALVLPVREHSYPLPYDPGPVWVYWGSVLLLLLIASVAFRYRLWITTGLHALLLAALLVAGVVRH